MAEKDSERVRDPQAGGSGEASARQASVFACDACGAPMRPMGHCKYWCLRCGFLRTCNDVL